MICVWKNCEGGSVKTAVLSLLVSGMVVLAAEPLARVGIITDTHVTPDIGSCRTLEKAFRLFKVHGVDMIVHCGDIADRHAEKAYENYRRTIRKVYPVNKPKEIFAFANHDILDVCGPEEAMTKAWPLLKKRLEIEHDYYSRHELAGYIFLTAPQIADWKTAEKMISTACRDTPGKPVFLVDHVPAADTTFDTKTWGYAATRQVYDKYPQVVQLSGHVHGTFRNEQNIWQGNFTVVNAGCTGQFWGGGLIGTPPPERRSDEAIILEIFKNRLVFRRFDLAAGEEYKKDEPWCVPIPFEPKNAPYSAERRKLLPAPEFAEGSRIAVTPDRIPCNSVRITFPDARTKNGDGVYIYRVSLSRRNAAGSWEDFSNFEVSGNYLTQTSGRRTGVIVISAGYFDAGKEYKIRIVPVNFFGREGMAAAGSFVMPEKTKWQVMFESADPMKDCPFMSDLTGGVPLKVENGFYRHEFWEARLLFPKGSWTGPAGTRFRFTVDLHMKQPSPEKQWTIVLRNPEPLSNANVRISTPAGDSGPQRYVIEFAKKKDFFDYYLLIREGRSGLIRFNYVKIEKEVPAKREKNS